MSEERSISTCQNCGKPLEADWKLCPFCRTLVSSAELKCPKCKNPIKEDWEVCPRCCTILSDSAEQEEEQPETTEVNYETPKETDHSESQDIVTTEKVQWYRLNENFKANIIERIATDRVLTPVHKEVVYGIDGLDLTKQECAAFWAYHKGELTAIFDLGAILACGRFDDLQTYLSVPKTGSDDLYYLSVFIKERDSKNALYELEKAFERCEQIEPILLLIAGFGAMEKARGYLSYMMENAEDMGGKQLLDAAKIWKIFFNDEPQARACITKAEKKEPGYMSLDDCGRVYEMLLKDSDQARRCLGEEEERVACSFQAALSWKILFDDSRGFIRCMNKVEKAAFCATDWINCAEYWKVFLQDEREFRRCLEQTKKFNYEGELSGEIVHFFNLGETQEARAWLKEMEKRAKYSSGWIDCADTWKRTFNEDSEIKRCLKKAESTASEFDYDDSLGLAKALVELLGDERKARKYMKTAEKACSDWEEWEECATTWKEVFGDMAAVERCKAEADEAKELDDS